MKDEIKEIFDYFRQYMSIIDCMKLNEIEYYIINLQKRIDKANEVLKDTSVDMPETLLIETIDYARHILNGDDNN